MASARQAALLERRKGELKRRILSPANTSVSSIAKKTATNELNAMISKYNSGLVGNDEMKVFLQKMLTTPGISDADKLDVQEQVRDFDSRIMKDKLEADFKGAQENSLTQAQAAIALSNYHKQRAAAMVAGTPAYSTAMENAATWDNKVQDINRNVAKTARTNQRLTKEQQIAQYPHNSSDRATAKAQAFLELYNQAATDGDATEANRYYRDYQEQLTYAQELGTRETEQADKEAKSGRRRVIIDTINQLANAYHDGQITANQFAQAIPEIEAAAVEIGDTSIQLQLNRWADSLAKDVAKGVRRGEIQGLPTVVGKGGTGAGGTQTDWDVQDHDYSDNIRLAQSALKTGKFSSEIYLQAIGTAIQERANQLQNRLETIDAIASENPNAKITYNGRKQRAEDVLKNLEEEWQSIDEQANAANSGNFALKEVPPSEGAELGKGKSVVTYKIIDPRTLEEGTYVPDEQGVIHELLQQTIPLTSDQMQNISGGWYTDPQNPQNSGPITQDKSGKILYKPQGQQVYRTWMPGLNKYQEFGYKQGEIAKSAEQIQNEAEADFEAKAIAKEQAGKQITTQAPIVQKPGLLEMAKKVAGETIEGKAIKAVSQKAGEIKQAIGEKIGEVIAPAKPKVIAPAQPLPPGPSTTGEGWVSKPTDAGYASYPPIVQPKPTAWVSKPTAAGYASYPAVSKPVPPKNLVQTIQRKAQPIIQKIAPIIKQSPIDWLKKKFGW